MPAGKLLPVRIGDVDVYVDTLPTAPAVGSEPHLGLRPAAPQEAAGVEQVADVFPRVCSGLGGSLPDAEPGAALESCGLHLAGQWRGCCLLFFSTMTYQIG